MLPPWPFPWAMLSGRPGRCGSLVVFLALLAGFVAPAKGSVSCDTYDEDDCAADSDCVWIEDWDSCLQLWGDWACSPLLDSAAGGPTTRVALLAFLFFLF